MRVKVARCVPVFLLLLLGKPAQAGIIGWLTSEPRDWQFINSTGGVQILGAVNRGNGEFLAIDYWPEGNSGLAVRKVEARKKGRRLVIRIFTQLVEKGGDTSRIHFADISDVPPGMYEVYYAGNPETDLGPVAVPLDGQIKPVQ